MKNPNESRRGRYENQNENGVDNYETLMKFSDKKMKAVWNWNEIDNEIFMKCTYDILLQVMSEAQHLNEWET